MEDMQPSALPTAEAQPGHRQRFIKHPKSGLLETLSPGNPEAHWMLEQACPLHRGEQGMQPMGVGGTPQGGKVNVT